MSDRDDSTNDSPEAPRQGRGSFADAIGRATRRSSESSIWIPGRNHVFYRAAQRGIAQPLREIFQMLRGMSATAKQIRDQVPPQELFLDISLEQLDLWIRNAQIAFFIQSIFALLGALIIAWGTTRSGFTGLSTMVGGMLMVVFAASNGLRAARDVEIFRTRQPLPFSAFMDQIDQLWCPLPSNHPLSIPTKFIILPLTALTILSSLFLAIAG